MHALKVTLGQLEVGTEEVSAKPRKKVEDTLGAGSRICQGQDMQGIKCCEKILSQRFREQEWGMQRILMLQSW